MNDGVPNVRASPATGTPASWWTMLYMTCIVPHTTGGDVGGAETGERRETTAGEAPATPDVREVTRRQVLTGRRYVQRVAGVLRCTPRDLAPRRWKVGKGRVDGRFGTTASVFPWSTAGAKLVRASSTIRCGACSASPRDWQRSMPCSYWTH